MSHLLFKLISLFRINQKESTTTLLSNHSHATNPNMIAIPNSHDDAVQMFKDIGSLTLMRKTLQDKEKYYKDLYAKGTKDLADITGKTFKQKNELHKIVNTYHTNILLIEREIRFIDERLTQYTQKVFVDYLKLDVQYDKP